MTVALNISQPALSSMYALMSLWQFHTSILLWDSFSYSDQIFRWKQFGNKLILRLYICRFSISHKVPKCFQVVCWCVHETFWRNYISELHVSSCPPPPAPVLLTLAGALMLPVWYPICREPSTAARMEVRRAAVRWLWKGLGKWQASL